MSYSSEVLADSPVIYLKLDETAGATAADSSGNGRNGTHGAGVVVNQSPLLGDGSGRAAQYVASGTSTTRVTYGSWLALSTLTVEARIKPDAASLGTASVQIAGRYASGTTLRSWRFDIDQGKLRVIIRRTSGTDVVATGATSLVAGTEYTAAFTVDGATVSIFLNGVNDGSTSLGIAMSTGSSADLLLGVIEVVESTAAYHYVGILDEFSIMSGSLSSARLLARHQAAIAAGGGGVTGTLAASLPALAADLTGTTATPPVTGTLAASLPVLTADLSGTSAAPAGPVSGTLAAQLPTISADLTGLTAAPGVVSGVLAAQLPALAVALRGGTSAATTDTFNRTNGRSRSGTGWANLDEPVAAVPDTLTREPIRVMAQTLPAPTLEKGRPV